MSTQAVIESSAAEWLSILVFVFGGCCSNVWALEAVLKEYPGSGTFLTFSQIVYVAFGNLAANVEVPAVSGSRGAGRVASDVPGKAERVGGASGWSSSVSDWIPRLKPRKVPIWRWGVQVVLFLGVSLLNNRAFAYKIPLTLHIIFRSGGLCVSMLTGWLLAGKKYTAGQAFAGVVITAGIVLATLSAPSRRSAPSPSSAAKDAVTPNSAADTALFVIGIAMLCTALFMSALLGLWQEKIYKVYGTVWQEGLLYSHLLSIPFFAPFHGTINTTFKQYAATPLVPLSLFAFPTSAGHSGGKAGAAAGGSTIAVPSALLALVVNVVTQGFCIRGVNKLTARVSSTTVNLVLTVRKAVSLALSVWYYGSGVTPGLAFGGAMVLSGTIIYGLSTPSRPPASDHTSKKLSEAAPKETRNRVEGQSSSIAPTVPISTGSAGTIRQRKI